MAGITSYHLRPVQDVPVVPRSPLLLTKQRAREPRPEEPKEEFHARPVPKFLSVPPGWGTGVGGGGRGGCGVWSVLPACGTSMLTHIAARWCAAMCLEDSSA